MSSAIGDGVLAEGQRLPPIRVLAAELSLSPSTVAAAWGALARAGAIRTDGRRGSRVATLRPGPSRYRQAHDRPMAPRLDLSSGTPDPALLPDLGPSLARLGRRATAGRYLDDPTLPELAEALAPTWPAPPSTLTVVDGAMDGLDALARQTLRPGDLVVVENPAFPPLLDLLDALGVRILGVPLDDEGVVPDGLAAALSRRPTALFIQPRAHTPTGATLSPRRVEELAAPLEATSTLVVEDDSVGDVAESA
ncbi:MAG: aminotransferase class I/II-fold pyridoxal phosphate-dependent enzyme, partial [Solirubrobacteraceae bacterium]